MLDTISSRDFLRIFLGLPSESACHERLGTNYSNISRNDCGIEYILIMFQDVHGFPDELYKFQAQKYFR